MVTTGTRTRTLEGAEINGYGKRLIISPPARHVRCSTLACNIPTDQASRLLIIILRGSIGTSNGVVVDPAHEIFLVGFLDVTTIVCWVLVWSDSSWLLRCAGSICLCQDVTDWEFITSMQSGKAKGVHQGSIVVAKESVGVQVGSVFLDAVYVCPWFLLADKANEEFMWRTTVSYKQSLEFEWSRCGCQREPVSDTGVAVLPESLQCLIQVNKFAHLILPFKPLRSVCLKGGSTLLGATRVKHPLSPMESKGWHRAAGGGRRWNCAHPYFIDASAQCLGNHRLVLGGCGHE